ncbi:MBL fold metallo-hydrolase [Planctomycetota bacterium]
MRVETVPLGALSTNCFLLHDNGHGIVIDPGGDPLELVELCRAQDIIPELILATHGHFDHIGGVAPLKREWDIPYAISSLDRVHYTKTRLQAETFGIFGVESSPEPDIDLDGKPFIASDNFELEIIPTPGHSEGSITFRIENHLFVGDLIFEGSVGRTDFLGGSTETLIDSVQAHIFTLDEGIIYPGHGSQTTVEIEKKSNPFF